MRAFIELAVRLGAVIQATDASMAAERDRRFRDGGTEVFQFPSPALGRGLGQHGAALVGTAVPQFALGAGLLDDALGPRFALLSSSALRADAESDVERRGLVDLRVLKDRSDAMTAWLEEHRVGAVVLRPDRYVFGTARSPEDIDRLLGMLPLSSAVTGNT